MLSTLDSIEQVLRDLYVVSCTTNRPESANSWMGLTLTTESLFCKLGSQDYDWLFLTIYFWLYGQNLIVIIDRVNVGKNESSISVVNNKLKFSLNEIQQLFI